MSALSEDERPACEVLPNKVWLQIAMETPDAWSALVQVVPELHKWARNVYNEAVMMRNFTNSRGCLPNGERHGKHANSEGTECHYRNGVLQRAATEWLPLDIWKEIAMCAPSVWYILVRIVPSLREWVRRERNEGFLMRHFTNPMGRLPNGRLHGLQTSPGTECHYYNGEYHQDDDEPAVITQRQTASNDICEIRSWYQHGLLDRKRDLPALIQNNGHQEWRRNGNLHREGDEPAVIHSNGKREWWRDGKRHRGGSKPAVIDELANEQEWWCDGVRQWPAAVCPRCNESFLQTER